MRKSVEPAGVPTLPEVGSIVEVRGATWAVTDVRGQGISRSPADESRGNQQHVVSLQSLEEDRMGEELSVIWELEVGQTVLPDQGLPDIINADSFDDPNRLGAFVDAMRWGAVTSADAKKFQAPFRTGANLEPYQLEPLRRALSAPRTNLLLADDVGLGKTIEAGMVVEELLLRHRARTAIIVCPPSLCVKWREELLEKFGLDFVIVNSETLAESRRKYGLGANPFRLYPRVIVSMAWVPSIRAQRLLEEAYSDTGGMNSARQYSFDILVVDEAHHVAPAAPASSGRVRGYAVDSKRTSTIRRLAEHCEHRLFLSATPHNGYSESFTALLEMVDSRRFTRGAAIDEKALEEVTVRRLKTNIASLHFKERHIETIPFTPGDDEEQHYAMLVKILAKTAKEHSDRDRALGVTALLFKKRLLSSPWAFARTLSRYRDLSEDDGYDSWMDDDYYSEVMGSGQSDEEEGREEQPEFETLAKGRKDNPLAAAEEGQLDELEDWADRFEGRPNSRLEALIEWLDSVCRPGGGNVWSDERVVVFTEYADTLDWIQRILESRGYTKDCLSVIDGQTDAEERELIRARFNANPKDEPIRVLLATDAAGEGIDLQTYCHRLVNFDVPFNPSRLEQRIGRIDRYGQTQTPEIYYFRPSQKGSLLEGNLEFMNRLAQKVSVEVEDLKTVNPLIDREISDHFLGGNGKPQVRAADEMGRQANEIINKTLAGSVALNRQLTELADEYETSKRMMHLTEQAEKQVVDVSLDLTNQPPLITTDDPKVYRLPDLNPGWRPIEDGLRTVLDPDRVRPITFDADAARHNPDVAYMHLGSALMSKASRTLRGNLYGQESKLHRVTAVVVPGLDSTCAAAMSRLVLVGRGGLRVHEEMFVTGLRFRAQNLAEEKVQTLLADALDASKTLQLADPKILERLEREWDANNGRLRSRLEDAIGKRAETRKQLVESNLEERRESDLDRAKGIFEQFRRNLRDSLAALRRQDEDDAVQLSLWEDEEQKQRKRDIRKMEQRLDDLDSEESRELDMIRLRYKDVKPYVSIAALVFAVSERDAEQWRAE